MTDMVPELLTDELVYEQDLAPTEEELPDSQGRRKVATRQSDPTVSVLYQQYKDGDLALQPEFQRHFVWDQGKSSRLIESVLLGVPLPIFYFSEDEDGRNAVVDGQQRLQSVFDFLDGKLQLRGLRVLPEINKRTFKDLTKKEQLKIRNSALRTVVILPDSDADVKFDVFERLNTGSVALNAQELRNCVYRGAYNRLINDLSKDSDFRRVLGLKEQDKRMQDAELVLRFAAFYNATYLKYEPPMVRFLNRDMEQNHTISESQQKDLTEAFKHSVSMVFSLLGDQAFKRFYRGSSDHPNGRWEQKRFNTSLYDVLMWGFSRYKPPQVRPHLDAIREGLIFLMTEDDGFIEAIERSTSATRMVHLRFDKWREVLEGTLGAPGPSEPRVFSRDLKQQLFSASQTCAICGNQISDVDDSAVDHVKQYWTGGKTIPENARLTHRYCNWSRSRQDELPSEGST